MLFLLINWSIEWNKCIWWLFDFSFLGYMFFVWSLIDVHELTMKSDALPLRHIMTRHAGRSKFAITNFLSRQKASIQEPKIMQPLPKSLSLDPLSPSSARVLPHKDCFDFFFLGVHRILGLISFLVLVFLCVILSLLLSGRKEFDFKRWLDGSDPSQWSISP